MIDYSLFDDYMVASISFDKRLKLTSLNMNRVIHEVDTKNYL